MASPFMELAKKGTDFTAAGTHVRTAACEGLKDVLTTSPVLTLPDLK